MSCGGGALGVNGANTGFESVTGENACFESELSEHSELLVEGHDGHAEPAKVFDASDGQAEPARTLR